MGMCGLMTRVWWLHVVSDWRALEAEGGTGVCGLSVVGG